MDTDTNPLRSDDDDAAIVDLARAMDRAVEHVSLHRLELVERANGTRLAVAHMTVRVRGRHAERLLVATAPPGGQWRPALAVRSRADLAALAEVLADVRAAIDRKGARHG